MQAKHIFIHTHTTNNLGLLLMNQVEFSLILILICDLLNSISASRKKISMYFLLLI